MVSAASELACKSLKRTFRMSDLQASSLAAETIRSSGRACLQVTHTECPFVSAWIKFGHESFRMEKESSICRFRTLCSACARDLEVRFRAAVAIKLPGVANFLDFLQIQFGNEQFVFVAAGLRHNLSARIAEIALAVKFTDFPGGFRSNTIDGGDEILIGDGVGGLLELPQIFGESGNGRGGIVDNLCAVQSEAARAFGKVTVVTDVDADARVARRENRIARVAGREVELFPKAGVAVRDVVLAVFSEVAAVGVDDGGGIVIKPGHFDFVNGHDQDHLMLFGELLHARDGGATGDALGQFVPARLLLRAEIWTIKELLQTEDLHFFLRG